MQTTVDRLLVVSSLFLVVLTLIFSQFMDAQHFWQVQIRELKKELREAGLPPELSEEASKSQFGGHHKAQLRNARISSFLISVIIFITAYCVPIGIWTTSDWRLKSIIFAFIIALLSLGTYGALFAFGIVDP